MRRIKAGANQSIWDLAAQEYGSYDGIKQLIIDNPAVCDFEKSIPTGTEIIITGEPINKSLVEYLKSKLIILCTAIEVAYDPSVWILADGTWNDNGFWVNNALWID